MNSVDVFERTDHTYEVDGMEGAEVLAVTKTHIVVRTRTAPRVVHVIRFGHNFETPQIPPEWEACRCTIEGSYSGKGSTKKALEAIEAFVPQS